jgi:hypothetical protein
MPNRRHVSGKKSQERQRKAGARGWLEPGHPIQSVGIDPGGLSLMNPVKKQRLRYFAKMALKDQFGQECVIRVRVRTNRQGLPDNSRPGDSVDLFAAVPSVDQRAMLLVDADESRVAQHDRRVAADASKTLLNKSWITIVIVTLPLEILTSS